MKKNYAKKLTKILTSNIGEVPVNVVVILSECTHLGVYERLFAGVEKWNYIEWDLS